MSRPAWARCVASHTGAPTNPSRHARTARCERGEISPAAHPGAQKSNPSFVSPRPGAGRAAFAAPPRPLRAPRRRRLRPAHGADARGTRVGGPPRAPGAPGSAPPCPCPGTPTPPRPAPPCPALPRPALPCPAPPALTRPSQTCLAAQVNTRGFSGAIGLSRRLTPSLSSQWWCGPWRAAPWWRNGWRRWAQPL